MGWMTDGSRDGEGEGDYRLHSGYICSHCKITPSSEDQEVKASYKQRTYVIFTCGSCGWSSGELPIDPPHTMLPDEYARWCSITYPRRRVLSK
jgi:hypothetical protein